MNGYALTNHFRKLRARWDFTPLEAYLFFELVALCNDAGWPSEFHVKNAVLAGALSCSEQGLINARTRLAKAGLFAYVSGSRRTPTLYRFVLQGSTEFSHSPAKTEGNGSTQDSTQFSHSAFEHADGSTQGSTQGSTEFSPYIEQREKKTKETIPAADAALSVPSFSSAEIDKPEKPQRAAGKKKGLDHAAVAALPLPHPSAEFAELWRTFYTENTHQQTKPLSALEKLLARLGRWPEGAAVLVLEAAIESNWSGFAHDGAKKLVDGWLARPPQPTPQMSPGFVPEHQFYPAVEPQTKFARQLEAQEQAEQDARFAQYEAANATDASAALPDVPFEQFWEAFGKKVDQVKTQSAWADLAPAVRVAAFAKVPAYVASTPDPLYRKNPLNWLTGKCWLDEGLADAAPARLARAGFSVAALFGQPPTPLDTTSHLDPEALAANDARDKAAQQQRIAEGKQKRAAQAGEGPQEPAPPAEPEADVP